MHSNRLQARLFSVVAALAVMIFVPGVANATRINVAGTVDTAFNLVGGPPPFQVGDPVSGSFDIETGADNTFDVGQAVANPVGALANFSISVGPATFDLATSDFVEFSGRLSADGSRLERLAFDSFPGDVGLDQDYGLQVQGPPDLIYVTNDGFIHAPITTTVGAASTPVPEPGSLGLIALALAMIGVGSASARRRRI